MKKYLVITAALLLLLLSACNASADQLSAEYEKGCSSGYYDGYYDAIDEMAEIEIGEDTPTQRPANDNSGKSNIVYWVPDGKRYHKSMDCQSLNRSTDIRSGTREDAYAAGKNTPCQICY